MSDETPLGRAVREIDEALEDAYEQGRQDGQEDAMREIAQLRAALEYLSELPYLQPGDGLLAKSALIRP